MRVNNIFPGIFYFVFKLEKNLAEFIERHLAVMETKMLRWTSGVTLFDHIRSEDTRGRYEIAYLPSGTAKYIQRGFGTTMRLFGEVFVNDNSYHDPQLSVTSSASHRMSLGEDALYNDELGNDSGIRDLCIFSWNLRFLYRLNAAQQPVDTLFQYKTDITALQKMRWTGNGFLEKNHYI